MRRKNWLSPEYAIYVVMWLLFFLLPIIIFYLRSFTVTQGSLPYLAMVLDLLPVLYYP